MSTFNSADIAAFNGGVWVFCEQRQGTMMPTSFELISEGRKLAEELGTKLYGILLGHNIEGIAKELGGYGADGVYVCDHPLLENYTTDGYTKVICDTVMEYKPEVMLIGATNIGRDLGPRCAARLHTGLCADCTHLDIDVPKYKQFLRESSTLAPAMIDGIPEEDRNLKMTRPAFGGHLMATIICPRFRPAMATVRPGVMKKAEFDQAKADACELIKPTIALTENDMETQVVEVVKAAKKLVDLIGADVVVSVGRGISKDVEGGIKLAEELAELQQAVAEDSNIEEELGDLLFAAVKVARFFHIDAEEALAGTCEKFIRRFSGVEAAVTAQGRTMHDLDVAQLMALWNREKHPEQREKKTREGKHQ